MIVFADKSEQPSQDELEQALGEKIHLFNAIMHACQVEETVWKYYSKSSGWTLQCRRDGLNLFFIQVTDSGFYVWFTLSNQAKKKAIELVFNQELCKEISLAREYKEGTSFKVEVVTAADIADVIILAGLKAK